MNENGHNRLNDAEPSMSASSCLRDCYVQSMQMHARIALLSSGGGGRGFSA